MSSKFPHATSDGVRRDSKYSVDTFMEAQFPGDRCPACGGRGEVAVSLNDPPDWETCRCCGGSGARN